MLLSDRTHERQPHLSSLTLYCEYSFESTRRDDFNEWSEHSNKLRYMYKTAFETNCHNIGIS